MKICNKLNVDKAVARENQKTSRQSPAFGIFSVFGFFFFCKSLLETLTFTGQG